MSRLGRSHLIAVALILAAAIGAFLFVGDGAKGAVNFAPYYAAGTPNLSDPSPGAASDINGSFNLDAPNYNFGGVISFTPKDFFVAADADIPDGAKAGTLSSQATLGLLNNPCSNVLPVSFTFYDATTNKANQTTFDDQFNGGPGTGLSEGIYKYPDYLDRTFPTLQPRARLYGDTVVGGVKVSLNFLIFEPGTVISTASGVVIPTNPDLGYPSLTVLLNAGDPASVPAPSAITDFCTKLTTTTKIFGTTQDNPDTGANEAGITYRSNPANNGTFWFTTWAASQRDADGDGKENGLDPCPFDADPMDPRLSDGTNSSDSVNDSDATLGDGIPNICDPGPTVNENNSDYDQDTYSNRGDNCPLIANGGGFGPNNQKDSDFDGIGDACDQNPTTPDGAVITLCVQSTVDVGSGGAPFPDPNHDQLAPCGNIIGGATPTPSPTPSHTPIPSGPTPSPTPVGQTPTPSPTPHPTCAPTATPTPAGQTPSSTTTASPTPVCGSSTPTPVGSHTPTPTGSGGPTPTGAVVAVNGDDDCDGDVDSVDGLKTLRHVAGLPVTQTEPCPDIGSARAALAADQPAIIGDVDCDGDVDSVDGLKILRHVAGLSVTQTEPCADIGT